MPPIVFAVLGAIQGLIAAAPRVKEVVQSGKQMIDALFTAKLISKEQQDELHSWVTKTCEDFQSGKVPAHWRAAPDPE